MAPELVPERKHIVRQGVDCHLGEFGEAVGLGRLGDVGWGSSHGFQLCNLETE